MNKSLTYPLIVSDFDGTLVNKDGTISPENAKAIREYIAKGGKFAISTGRLPAGILPRAKELGLSGMVCACQGAIIMDIESKALVSSARLPYQTTLRIVRKMEEMGLHIHVYDLWDFYSNMDDAGLKIYENAVRGKAKLVLDKPLSKFVEENEFASYKLFAPSFPTVSLAIYDLQDNMTQGENNGRYPEFFAAIMISIIPVVTIFLVFQEQIMKISLGGGIKG